MKKEIVEHIIAEVNNGKHPKIMFGKGIEGLEISASVGQYGDIISITKESMDLGRHEKDYIYEVRISLEKYYEYNKTIDDHSWFNQETQEYTFSAEEAGHYPENHVVILYIDEEDEGFDMTQWVFTLIEEEAVKNLFEECEAYIHSQNEINQEILTYISWLEQNVLELRKNK